MFIKKKIKITTHNGSFHADDIFAVALLSIIFEKDYRLEIIRTRDQNKINSSDIVVDVGFIYDKEKNRFDHHQGGINIKHNDIPVASFGLVWDKYGMFLCENDTLLFNNFLKKIVEPIDRVDNGINIRLDDYIGYDLFDIIETFNNIDLDIADIDKEQYNNFIYLVNFAKNLILKEIKFIKDILKSNKDLENIYLKSNDKRLLILDKPYLYNYYTYTNHNILLVIFPESNNKNWVIRCANNSKYDFNNRILFPNDWAGKRDSDLEKVTNIKGSIFCHKNRFIFIASSKEVALKIAEHVLNNCK